MTERGGELSLQLATCRGRARFQEASREANWARSRSAEGVGGFESGVERCPGLDGWSVCRREIQSPPSIERSLTSGGGWHFSLGARAVFWWYYKRLLLVG